MLEVQTSSRCGYSFLLMLLSCLHLEPCHLRRVVLIWWTSHSVGITKPESQMCPGNPGKAINLSDPMSSCVKWANSTFSTGLLRWADKIILVKILEHTVQVLGIVLRGQSLSSFPGDPALIQVSLDTTSLKGSCKGHMNHQSTPHRLCFLQGPFSFVFSFCWEHGL